MDCKDGMLYERSRAYLSKNQDGKEDFTVAMPDEILKQKAEALPQLTADECYYVYMGEAFYYNLLNHNGILLHASCIEKFRTTVGATCGRLSIHSKLKTGEHSSPLRYNIKI